MEIAKLISDIIQALVLLAGAIWAYLKFFQEGVHRPRIELDVMCDFLGIHGDRRIAAFRVNTHNHGFVDFRFHDLRLRIRGISAGDHENQLEEIEIETMKGKTAYLSFPEKITDKSVSIIPKKSEYFFVRPGVSQQFSYTTIIPANWEYVRARASFKYPTTSEIHTSERTFKV